MITTNTNYQIKKCLLAASILLAVGSVSFESEAEEVQVIFGGWSQHINKCYDLENQDGEVLECRDYTESNKATGIKYNNFIFIDFTTSYGNSGKILGYDHTFSTYYPIDRVTVDLGAVIGLVKGYSKLELGPAYIGNDISLYFVPKVTTQYKIDNSLKVGFDIGLAAFEAVTLTLNATYTF